MKRNGFLEHIVSRFLRPAPALQPIEPPSFSGVEVQIALHECNVAMRRWVDAYQKVQAAKAELLKLEFELTLADDYMRTTGEKVKVIRDSRRKAG